MLGLQQRDLDISALSLGLDYTYKGLATGASTHPTRAWLGNTGWPRVATQGSCCVPRRAHSVFSSVPGKGSQGSGGSSCHLAEGHSVATVTSVCRVTSLGWRASLPPPSEFTLSVESLGDKNMETVAMAAILWSPQTEVQSSGCPGTAEMKIWENPPLPSPRRAGWSIRHPSAPRCLLPWPSTLASQCRHRKGAGGPPRDLDGDSPGAAGTQTSSLPLTEPGRQ